MSDEEIPARDDSGDAVVEDFLRGRGFRTLTAWHLRCLESYVESMRARWQHPRWSTLAHVAGGIVADLADRLHSDLHSGSLDAVHADAQWHHAEWTAAHRAIDGKWPPIPRGRRGRAPPARSTAEQLSILIRADEHADFVGIPAIPPIPEIPPIPSAPCITCGYEPCLCDQA